MPHLTAWYTTCSRAALKTSTSATFSEPPEPRQALLCHLGLTLVHSHA